MSNSDFEQKSITQKLKEYSTLIISVLIILLLSIAVMDLIVLPVSIFAIDNSVIFTQLFKKILILLIASYIIIKTIASLVNYYKNGLKVTEILKISLQSKIFSLINIIFLILIILLFIFLIKFLLEYNYYQIYRFLK